MNFSFFFFSGFFKLKLKLKFDFKVGLKVDFKVGLKVDFKVGLKVGFVTHFDCFLFFLNFF